MKNPLAYAKITDDCINCSACEDVCPLGLPVGAGSPADPAVSDISEDHVFIKDLYTCSRSNCEMECAQRCELDAIIFQYLPAAPTGLALSSSSGTNGKIKVSWNAVSGTGIIYEVYREDVDEGGGFQLIGTTSLTYLTDPVYSYVPNAGNVTCRFKVRAKNSGGRYSAFSVIVSVRAEP